MDMKITLLSIVFLIALAMPCYAFTIEGDTITYEGTYGKVSQTPHTLTATGNSPLINFTSYFLGIQYLDIAFGFDQPEAIPRAADYYNPHYEDVEHSYTCDYFFNYTTYPKHFYCYKWDGNITDYILIYDHAFDSGDILTQTAYWTENELIEWTEISDRFEQIDYDFDGKNTWYLIENVSFDSMETKTLKASIDVQPFSEGKYDIMIKRNQDSWAEAISSGHYVLLDPYWNTTNYTYNRGGNTSKTTNTYWRGVEMYAYEHIRVVRMCGESNIGIINASVSNENETCYATSVSNGCAEMNCNMTENHTYYPMINSAQFYFYPPTYPYPIETDYFNITCDAQGADEQNPPYICYNGGENYMNVRNITIQNADPTEPTSTNLTLNLTAGNITGVYGQTISAVGMVNVSGLYVECYHDTDLIDNDTDMCSDTDTWAAGLHNFTAYTFGNASFTSSIQTFWANLTQYSTSLSIANNTTSGAYPRAINVSGSGCPAQITCNLSLNGTNSSNPYEQLLGVGSYNFTYSTSGNENYTADSDAFSFVVSQGDPNLDIVFNETSPKPVETPINISCSKPDQVDTALYNDTHLMAGNSTPVVWITTGLDAGIYNFTCNSSAEQNYTADSITESFILTAGSGLSVNVFNEENLTQGLTFNITINNGTASNTAYDQNNPYTNSSIVGITTIDISADGYQPRSYYRTLGEDSTEVNATLLADGSGSWVLFYVFNIQDNPIEAALIEVERLYAPASYVVVAEKKTDASGVAAIFLDTTTTYRLNLSATNYDNKSITLQPAASPYVIYMNSSELSITYDDLLQNMIYQITPSATGLTKKAYNFSWYVNSTDGLLEYAGMNITFWNGTSLYYNNTTATDEITFTTEINMSLWDNTTYLQAWFKKENYTLFTINKTYNIWAVNASNTSIQAIADDIKTGAIDIDATTFMFITLIITTGLMAATGSKFKMFGAGIFGIAILAIFTIAGTYIYGTDYIIGWEMLILMSLGIAALLYLRRG